MFSRRLLVAAATGLRAVQKPHFRPMKAMITVLLLSQSGEDTRHPRAVGLISECLARRDGN